jgi:nitroreductase
MTGAPCIVFALALPGGTADSVVPAVQNLMLAARAIGIGSVPTTLHPSVMSRFHAMLGIPSDVSLVARRPIGDSFRRESTRVVWLDRPPVS